MYAAARDPSRVTLPGVVPIRLDVTRPEDATAAARECDDVTLLDQQRGHRVARRLPARRERGRARAVLETNFFGPLHVSRAFAPVLAKNGGGAILNVLSVASWISGPSLAVYGASKSAAWAMTNALRIELEPQKTQVLALHAGFIDTDLTRDIDAPKARRK